MKRLIRNVAAAALATAFSATPALAHDRDRDDRDDWHRAPPPVVVYQPAPRPAYDRVRWERRELRHEYAELEQARDHFYSRWHGPGQVRKFERWYAMRRAELDQRWAMR